MTAQLPDRLLNKCPDIDFGDLRVYEVISGNIMDNFGWGKQYLFKNPASPPVNVCSANWRGFISTFELTGDGELILICRSYLNREDTLLRERLEGSFWMVMKSYFYGPRNYVPFVNGIIVKDKSKWIVEDMNTRLPSRHTYDP